MTASSYTRSEIELLVFELGGAVFGADASQVLRIDRPVEGAGPAQAPGPLGVATQGSRALVFKTEGGYGQLRVDGVRGVRQVAVDSLRRLPQAATAQPYAIGVWLDGDRPVLLIDLVEMVRHQGRQ